MMKIARIMDALPPDHQRVVAFEVYRTYGGSLTGAQRQAMYRQRNGSNERVTESPPESDAVVTSQSNERVTENVTDASLRTSQLLETSVFRNRNARKEEATEVLNFLNQKTGKAYRYVEANLSLIEARLRSGASVQDCKSVIARKCREWGEIRSKDEKDMRPYLRPKTLFSAANFEQYLGECLAE